MEFTAVPTEQTTAVTDLALAALTLCAAAGVHNHRAADPWKSDVWTWAFLLLGAASLLGAVAHGLVLAPAMVRLLWQPLYISLGMALALFVVGAVHDLLGQSASRRLLPFALGAGIGFFMLTRLLTGDFLLFVLYEAFAMLIALGIYLRLLVIGRPGAAVMVAGIAITIVAAMIQTRSDIHVSLVWSFDHNGIFHLVQISGVAALMAGLRKSMPQR